MIRLSTGALDEIVVVGAHCDDIAIGMGGTLLSLAETVRGCVCGDLCCLAAAPNARPRSGCARRRSVPARTSKSTVLDIPDGRAPAHWERIKNHLSEFPSIVQSRCGIRPATRRRSPRSPAARRTVADGVSRPSCAGLRDPQVGERHPAPDDLPPARNRRGRGEGTPATQALSIADEPRLVRRGSVSRPVETSWSAVPKRARRGLHCGKGDMTFEQC